MHDVYSRKLFYIESNCEKKGFKRDNICDISSYSYYGYYYINLKMTYKHTHTQTDNRPQHMSQRFLPSYEKKTLTKNREKRKEMNILPFIETRELNTTQRNVDKKR